MQLASIQAIVRTQREIKPNYMARRFQGPEVDIELGVNAHPLLVLISEARPMQFLVYFNIILNFRMTDETFRCWCALMYSSPLLFP
jgi:hypothetical protein